VPTRNRLQPLIDLRARHADAGIVHRCVWQGDTGPTNDLEVWHANAITYIVRIYRRDGPGGHILSWEVYVPASLDNLIASTIDVLDALLTQPTRQQVEDSDELSPSSEWPIVVMNVPADVPADVADDIIESAEDAHEVRITVFRRGDVVDFIMPDDPDGLRHALLGIASDRIDEAGLPDALVAN